MTSNIPDYEDLISQIPQEAWQFVSAEVDEDDETGEALINFQWDDKEHPELKPLTQLSEEQWNDFVQTALQNAIQNIDLDDNETEGESEPSDRDDREGGELD
jgi:hypothetical protein